jgi:hypothetical protein
MLRAGAAAVARQNVKDDETPSLPAMVTHRQARLLIDLDFDIRPVVNIT